MVIEQKKNGNMPPTNKPTMMLGFIRLKSKFTVRPL
jgi:hypothetical protein